MTARAAISERKKATEQRLPAAWTALAVLLLFASLGAAASYSRGIWFDEAWSIYQGQRDVSLVEALRRRWLVEVWPPFFYAFTWLFQPLTGDAIFGRRLLNLLPLCLAALAFILVRSRYPRQGPFVLLFGILLLSHPRAMSNFAEHRAYFAILAGAAVVAASLATIVVEGKDYRRSDRLLLGLTFAGMFAIFSFHYVVALEAAVVVGVFIVALWLQGQRRWAAALALAGLIAGIPLVLSFLAQQSVLRLYGDKGWIDTSNLAALKMLGTLVAVTALTMFVPWLTILRSPYGQDSQQLAGRRLLITTLIALVCSWAVLIAANTVQPLVIVRYLLVYIPFMMAPVAVLAARRFASNGLTFAATTGIAVALIAVVAGNIARQERWNTTGKMIAGERSRCPGTLVHVVPFWRFKQGYLLGPDEMAALRAGSAKVADKFRFEISPRGSRSLSPDCPTVLWVEHHYENMPSPQMVVARSGLPVSGSQAMAAVNLRGTSGFITLIPPDGR